MSPDEDASDSSATESSLDTASYVAFVVEAAVFDLIMVRRTIEGIFHA